MGKKLRLSKPIDVLGITALFFAAGLAAGAYGVYDLYVSGLDIVSFVASIFLMFSFICGAISFYIHTGKLEYSDKQTGVMDTVTTVMEAVTGSIVKITDDMIDEYKKKSASIVNNVETVINDKTVQRKVAE